MSIYSISRSKRSTLKTLAVVITLLLNFTPTAAAFAQTSSTTDTTASTDQTSAGTTTDQSPAAPDQSPSTDTSSADTSAPAPQVLGASTDAQTSTDTSAPSPADQTSQPATPDNAPSSPTTDQSAAAQQTPQALPPSGSAGPLPTVPNSFSYQTVSPKIDGATGALTESIPLDIPPGRNGVQPDLELQYNSQNTDDGIVGYGWSLSIPYVQRLNKTGSQNLYVTNPYFTSSIDGELASTTVASSTTYRARVDSNGNFDLYSYATSTNSWTMYDKTGTKYTFGASSQSQENASTSPSTVYKWMLSEIRDTNNNYVKFVYAKDGNQIYPLQIIYTGNGVTDGPATITFATSSRPDAFNDYKAGFKVFTNYRVSQITMSFNGANVRQYTFSYTTGNNGFRSLLSSVQETGWNDNNVQTTLPAMTFGYVSSSTAFVSPPAPTAGGGDGAAYIIADADGDGINDITNTRFDDVTLGVEGSLWQKGIGSGTTITPPGSEYWSYYPLGSCSSQTTPQERGVRYLDVTGSGKADVVRGYRDNAAGTSTDELYLNTSSPGSYSWVGTTTYSGVIPDFGYSDSNAHVFFTTGIFGDVNGTGLPSFEQHVGTYYTGAAYLANGSAWNAATTTVFSPYGNLPDGTSANPDQPQLVDINGDGLADWVYTDSNDQNIFVALDTGTGWETSYDPEWTIATSSLYASGGNYYDRGIRFLDVNGDGLPDLIHSYSYTAGAAEQTTYNYVQLNTGHGWATSTTAYSLPTYITNGSSSGTCSIEEANWMGNGQQDQDVLSTITYPKGGSTNVTYQYTTQTGTNSSLPINFLVVSKIVTNDGLGNTSEIDKTYSGGKLYTATGAFDRKFAGFAVATTTNPDSIVTTYYDQDDGVQSSLGEQSDGYAQIGHPFREDTFNLSGTLMRQIFDRWDTATVGSSTLLHLGQKIEQDYNGDGTHIDQATTYAYATSTDNLIETDEYGQVTGGSNGTFTDTGSDKRVTTTTYAASSTVNLFAPTEQKLYNQASTTVKDTKFNYDGLAFGSVGKGNPTMEQDWISGSRYASTTKAYNSYGLVATSTDADGNATKFIYDTFNLNPATTTNALSQSTAYTYNYSNGQAEQTIDPNANITKNSYDGVGRLTEVDKSDVVTPSTLDTNITYQYTDNSTPPSIVHEADYLNSATTTDTYSYSDGLGRLIEQRKSSETSGTFIEADHAYNSAGLVKSESLPYLAAGSSYGSATTTGALFTNYAYDALERPLTIANSVGTTTNVYTNWKTNVTDPRGNAKNYIKDAFGNMIQVEEVPGTQITTYNWDALNGLTKLTDAASNVRNFTNDGLGRRTAAEDLHASGDGTFGVWMYGFDDAGNFASSTDPKSQVVKRTYDALNRLITEDYTGASGTELTNTYDTCTRGIGQLCSASSTSALIKYSYNPLGLIATATSTIGGVSYANSFGYDRQGDTTSVTYPNNDQVSYTYNNAAQVGQITRKPSGGSWANVVTDAQHAPAGQVAQRVFGNGATTTLAYDAAHLYRLNTLQTAQYSTATSSVSTSTIAYDNSAIASVDGSGLYSGSYTTSGSNRLLIACIQHNDGSGGLGGTLSYGGVNLTRLVTKGFNTLSSPANWLDVYYLIGPASGSNTFSVSADTGGDVMIASYNGVSQSSFPDAYSTGGMDSGTSWTTTLTPSADKTWIDICTGSQREVSAGAGVTLRQHPTGAGSLIGDSNGAITPPASHSMTVNSTAVSGSVMVSFAPAVTSSGGAPLIQNIAYGYDANQNITSITDTSTTTAAKTVVNTYDTLNRLVSTQVTNTASNSDYGQTFTYDQLDNILSVGPSATSSGIAFDNSATATLDGSGAYTGSYTTSGSNRLMIACVAHDDGNGGFAGTMSYGGTSLTRLITKGDNTLASPANWVDLWYLKNPTLGSNTFTVSSSDTGGTVEIATYDGASQSGFPNATSTGGTDAATSWATTATSTADRSWASLCTSSQREVTTGTGETLRQKPSGGGNMLVDSNASITPAGPYTMTTNITTSAVGGSVMATFSPASTTNATTYAYAQTGEDNPDAVTSVGYGTATTTLGYDNDGNEISALNGATTTTLTWDYRNRLTAVGINGATSTYGYDFQDNRVQQTYAGATTTYPSKFYSIASKLVGATTYATTTENIYDGDTLIATVDQALVNGTATGTTRILYIHPDQLGSTNVVTDASSTVVQTLDYYPYGQVRLDTNAGKVTEGRKYIGQFLDDPTSLSYLNARYFDPSRGQFLSQDPVFLADPRQQNLTDPQSLNSYSYADDNPITKKDPSGRCLEDGCVLETAAALGFAGGVVGQGISDYQTGAFSRRTALQNLGVYAAAGTEGAVVGAGTVASGFAAAALGLSAGATALTVGGTAGVLNAGTTIAGNSVLGQPTDYGNLAFNSVIAAGTAGTLEGLPKVRGRLPVFGSQAFFTGAHAQMSGAQAMFSTSIQSFGQTSYNFYNGNNQGSRSQTFSNNSGGGSSSNLIGLYQSLVSVLTSYVSALGTSRH